MKRKVLRWIRHKLCRIVDCIDKVHAPCVECGKQTQYEYDLCVDCYCVKKYAGVPNEAL